MPWAGSTYVLSKVSLLSGTSSGGCIKTTTWLGLAWLAQECRISFLVAEVWHALLRFSFTSPSF